MSIEKTLAERGNRYGDFADHAKLCQKLKQVMQTFSIHQGLPGILTARVTPWEKLNPVQKQALEVIADKIARILSGDPNYADNWHDIQGYAKLVEDRLPTVKESLTVEPASQIDDESPRMQAIAQNGNDGAAYSEIDRLRAAEAFNADLPVREHYVLAPFQATCANLTIEQARELERNFRSRDLIQFCVTDLHICPHNGSTAKLMSVKVLRGNK